MGGQHAQTKQLRLGRGHRRREVEASEEAQRSGTDDLDVGRREFRQARGQREREEGDYE